MATLSRTIFVRGILGFGLTFALLTLAWDWLDGTTPAWPRPVFKYAFYCVVGGVLHGLLMWRLERTERLRALRTPQRPDAELPRT